MRFSCRLCAIAALVAALATAPCGAVWAQRVVTIHNDGGGVLRDYVVQANLATLRGDLIRIDGWCASACTAYLGTPNTCVTPSASFGFHGPSGGTVAENRRAALLLARHLPPALRQWFMTNAAHLKGVSYLPISAARLVQMGGARWC